VVTNRGSNPVEALLVLMQPLERISQPPPGKPASISQRWQTAEPAWPPLVRPLQRGPAHVS